jgi:hypothetical protein
MKIDRHMVDSDSLHRPYEFSRQQMDSCLENVRKNPSVLSLLISHAKTVATCGSVIAPESEEIRAALKIASQACAALFALASNPGTPVTVHLGDGEPVTIAGYRSDSSVEHVDRWLEGFYLASLCRDRESLALLFKTPLDTLKRSSTRGPEYRQLLAEALHGWHAGEEEVTDKFIAAMEATDPDRKDILNVDYTLQISVPTIQCLFYVLSEDKDLADAIIKAAESHKKYWKSTKQRRQDNWDGFLSIPLLGIAAMAHDRKMPFELDCDYVPMDLVRGDG